MPSQLLTAQRLRSDVNELFIRWQHHGDRQARDRLVEQFLPLARKLARRYSGANEPLDDLVQVASLALVKAIDRFDIDRGLAFSSFAVPTILGELKRYFRDLGWAAHVPRGAQELALRVQEASNQLAARTGRSPTLQELAQYLEFHVEDVVVGLEAAAAHHSISLDVSTDDDQDDAPSLAEAFGEVDHQFEQVELGATIASAARHLGERERRVLLLRFFYDCTQSQIANEIGVSQMQVSRILRRALAQVSQLTGARS